MRQVTSWGQGMPWRCNLGSALTRSETMRTCLSMSFQRKEEMCETGDSRDSLEEHHSGVGGWLPRRNPSEYLHGCASYDIALPQERRCRWRFVCHNDAYHGRGRKLHRNIMGYIKVLCSPTPLLVLVAPQPSHPSHSLGAFMEATTPKRSQEKSQSSAWSPGGGRPGPVLPPPPPLTLVADV